MKNASRSFLVLFFAALMITFQSYAQSGQGRGPRSQPVPRPGEDTYRPIPLPGNGAPLPQYPQQYPSEGRTIQQIVRMQVRSFDLLDVAQLLRLTYEEESSLQVVSLTIVAQGLMGPSQIQLTELGRLLDSESVSRQLSPVFLHLPGGSRAQGLELRASSDLFIESISAEVISSQYTGPGLPQHQQVQPNQLLSLRLSQNVRGYALIDLDQLARQQMGLTLQGAQIQRVVVNGSTMMGRPTSVQVQMNSRPASDVKFLSAGQRIPLPVQSFEEVRDLDLMVNGDAQIFEVHIRIGNVRPLPQGPVGPQRVYVGQQIGNRFPLELSRIFGSSNGMIRSLTIEARSVRQFESQLQVLSGYGEVQGMLFVRQNTIRATIQLRRPMMLSELRLESLDPVWIETLEVQYDTYRGF